MVAKERAKVSWLRGVETVMSQCGKFEIDNNNSERVKAKVKLV